ncbi:MAG: lipopolysaccharide biosynthesis protein [Roseiarcus sp.]|jgi:O-antigen/teichoic acid export membrane protein
MKSIAWPDGFKRLLLLTKRKGDGEGLAAERERRALLTAISAATAKLITVATMLVSVPLTLHYLGPERYGLWMAMSSAVYVLGFADLGIGSALINMVADAHGRDDRSGVRAAVSTATLLFVALALVILTAFSVVYAFAPWSEWFNVQSEAARAEVGPGLAVLVACFALSIPLSVTPRVQTAMQEGYKSNLWAAFGSLSALAGILLAIRLQAGLPWLALAFAGAPQVAGLVNAVILFAGKGRDIAPSPRFASRSLAMRVVGAGTAFLGIQIVVAINVASDNLIIARTLGPQAVTAFAVPERMFGLIPMLIHLALQPLWPAYTEALARRDHSWISRTLRRSFLMALLASVIGLVVLVAFGRWIVDLWTGGSVIPSFGLLAGLGLWKLVDSIEYALTVFLASAGALRPQLIFGMLAMAAAILGKVYLLPMNGVEIVPWVSGLARITLSLFPLYIFAKTVANEARDRLK